MNLTIRKILLIFLLLIGLCACSAEKEEEVISSVQELDGRNMGCMSGSIFDELIKEKFPDSEIIYFNSRSELLLGLTAGKIDGFVSDEPVAMMMTAQNEQVSYLDEAVGQVEYGICFSDNAKNIMDEFNKYLADIKDNGHLDELINKWITPEGLKQLKVEHQLDGKNGTITCVTTPDAAPFSFIADNVFQGFEVELLNEFCYEYGYGLEINTVSFDALLTSVAMNKYDVAFNGIYITPERAKSVNFCTSTFQGRDVVMIRSGAAAAENKDFLTTIKESFYKNFIEEDRYKLLLSGALTTLIISSLSIICGTLLGLLIFLLAHANDFIRKMADLIQRLLAKLPAVVLLMLLFYVVFKSSSISAVIVSIIGFSYMFAHVFYGLLKVGVAAVEHGQTEAAMALGYESMPAFFHIILPQALKTVFDSYLSEVISLIKNTSIVGYVSVNDVTRSSDIIRGRTYDALFPLIVTAFIYYLLCTLLVLLIRMPLKAYIGKKVRYDQI